MLETINHSKSIYKKDNTNLKTGIWVYFFLLIFEGALRKWVLPELANVLLLIRDPVALYLLILAGFYNIHYFNTSLFYVFIIIFLSIFNTMVWGHGSVPVTLYGARIFLIHFPIIFVIGRVFNRSDVIKMGLVIIYLSIPMAILVGFQFFSPQSAWVNRGIGGDLGGGGFSGAMGYLRPPATFSFTNGTTFFFTLVAVFVFYFWIYTEKINKIIHYLATIALISSIAFSISRSLFFQVIISFIFTIVGSAILKNKKSGGFTLVLGVISILFFLSFFNVFSIGLDAFSSRLERANSAEGGVESVFIDRYLGGLVNALMNSTNQPFTGFGLGYGTNVGSNILTNKRSFLISEGEWGRLIGELGPILGIAIIFIRLSITFKLAQWAWKYLLKNDLLPWLILSYVLLMLPQGGWSQPTSQGFCVLISGLLVASFNSDKEKIKKKLFSN